MNTGFAARAWTVVLAAGLVLGVLAPAKAATVRKMTVTTPDAGRGYRFVGAAVIDAEPRFVREFFMQPCADPAKNRFLKECRVVAREEESLWVYGLVEVPFVSARDFTSRRTLDSDLRADGDGTFRLVRHLRSS